MYTIRFWIVLLFISALSVLQLFAQHEQIHIEHGCNFDHRAEAREYFTSNPSSEAEAILKELCIALGIDRSSIALKSANVSNAVATKIDGNRYILYSSEFLSRAKPDAQSRWAVYSILAHEIGHHILGHNFEVDDPGLRKLLELEADRFSGRMLRNLCSEEADALLAMRMVSDVPKEGYPIVSARRDAISSGWVQQDLDLANGRRDPCADIIIEPQFGRQYGKINHAKDVKAIVGQKSIRFQFNVQGQPGRSDYSTFIVVPPGSLLSPENLEFVTPANSIGNQREIIWNFAEEGLSQNLAMRPDELGVAVFEDRKIPNASHWTGFALPALAVAVGGVSLGIGYDDIGVADDLFHNTYAAIRDPEDLIYQGINPSRTELLTQINDTYRRGQGFRNAGYGLIIGGAALLWRQFRRHKRSKIGLLFDGQNGVGIRVTPDDLNQKFFR